MTTIPVSVSYPQHTDTPSVGGSRAPQLRAVRYRRPNRAWETAPDIVRAAIPEGSARAGHSSQVIRALEETAEYARMTVRRRRSIRAVLDALIQVADYDTMTTRPTWDWLQAETDLSRSTVALHLATLHRYGLLGTVATGRQAQYAAPGPDGKRINEAAVYVLCYPSPITAAPQPAAAPVDQNRTPPPRSGLRLKKVKETTHTREEKPQTVTASPRRSASGGSAATTNHSAQRQDDHWPAHRRTASKIQRVQAAKQLQSQTLSLRSLTPRDIASCCRDFFLAGWTVNDLVHALDHSPTGLHALDALAAGSDTARTRGWLRWRLGAWRDDHGTPMTSRTQRVAAEQAEAHARARRELQRIKTERLEQAQRVANGDSAEKISAFEAMRQIFRRNRAKDHRG